MYTIVDKVLGAGVGSGRDAYARWDGRESDETHEFRLNQACLLVPSLYTPSFL